MPLPLVRVADVKHAVRISLHRNGIAGRTRRPECQTAAMIVVISISISIKSGDPADIILRFRISRHSGTARYRARPGVVSGQCKSHVAFVTF